MSQAPPAPKPLASLSLDLDNQWSYMKTHGDDGWQSFPSYFDVCVPRIIDMTRRLGLTMTVFVVGQDAALAGNRAALASIAAAGHEIGNHSFHHEPWLHLYSDAEIAVEIAEAEAAIEAATTVRPRGFRGPGFSVSKAVLETLAARGYRYDASTFPTFLGPLARAYYFFNARLSADDKARRRLLFGSLGEGLRPLRPYAWQLSEGTLLEIPVTTMPIVRAPAMAMPAAAKLAVTEQALAIFRDRFDVLAMGEHARRIEARGGLRLIAPKMATAGAAPAAAVGARRGIAP